MDRELLERGVTLLRAGDYFGAHEAWEDGWRPLSGDLRRFWQCMIQLAVGAYHFGRGNLTGTRNTWRKALRSAEELHERYPSVAPAGRLVTLLQQVITLVHAGGDPLATVEEFAQREAIEDWSAELSGLNPGETR